MCCWNLYCWRVVLVLAFLFETAAVAVHAESSSEKNHWAFQPLQQVTPPDDPTGWAMQGIDKFIIQKLHDEQLQPVELADKRTLIRRLYFDLIGLPPTPDQIDAFLADASPEAYSNLVDRLLDSEHYGERWGRHWLDVVRYADTAGDNSDCPVPEMYLYRDYVIDAFNADKPYDVFLHEQLAGDILAKENPEERLAELVTATGYIALGKRFGNKPYAFRHMEIGDVIDCTGRAFLGITMACARCHDHKFDPMTNEDYYALYGIFESTNYSFSGSEASKDRMHLVSLAHPQQEYLDRKQEYDKSADALVEQIKELEEENPLATIIKERKEEIPLLEQQINQRDGNGEDVTQLREKLAKLVKERDEAGAELAEKLKEPKAQLAEIEQQYAPLLQTVAFAAYDGTPTDVPLQQMGDHENPGESVKRGVPQFLAGDRSLDIPEGTSGRLQLARWLTEKGTVAGGLSARVMANRIWQHHFGQGLVTTPSNFGLNGKLPTNAALLEWLAGQFVDQGWSIKTMHRLIVHSQAYRLSSQYDVDCDAKDPSAAWVWRYNRRRLDAEAIRDAMLAVSGNLDRNRSGPHPFPPQKEWGYSQHKPFKEIYPSNHRSIFLMTLRNLRHPYLAIFDGADPNLSTGKRTRSLRPQQALYLMNNPFVGQQATGFAQQLIEAAGNDEDRIAWAHQAAWGRVATPAEIKQAMDYLKAYQAQLRRDDAPADQVEYESWTSYAQVMLTSNEFMYVE